jgi:hypothetical protein
MRGCGPAHTQGMRFLVILICLQTAAEVLPVVASGVPWTQPQAMKYGGFVFIVGVAIWFCGGSLSESLRAASTEPIAAG